MDSYYFASLSCHTTPFRPDVDSIFTGIFFVNLPCNLLVFKIILIAIFGICVGLAQRLGERINKTHGAWLPYFFGLSLSYYTYFSKMEDDTLGMPFVFVSLYYLWEYSTTKSMASFLKAILIIGVGLIVWKGIAIWLLIALAVGPIGWMVSSVLMWGYQDELFSFPVNGVSEAIPIAGVLANGLILIGALALPPYFIPSLSLAFILAIVKLKYSLYLGLLCGLGVFYYVSSRGFFEGDSKSVLGYPKATAFIGILVLINFVGIFGVMNGPPTLSTVQLVQTFSTQVHDANSFTVYNDWELGHLVAYNGLVPSNEFGPPTPSFFDTNGFVLTHQFLDCPLLEESDGIHAYDCQK